MRGDEVVSVRGDARRRLQPRLPLPEVAGPEAASRGSRPPDARRSCAATASWSRRVGTRRSRRSSAGSRRRSPSTGATRSPSTSATPPPTASDRRSTGTPLIKALGTKNIYSASTVDQMPKQVSAGLMFGGGLSVPVPDVDRTDHLLILGANPLVSNGSLLTAPDMRGRIRAIRERGGKVVVIDPRRSRTAKEASEHHFIRPGTDAHLLFAIANVLIAEGLADARARSPSTPNGGDRDRARWRAPFTPEAVAPVCGIDADEIRRIARELAAAERAAVYARIGTTTQRFGTLASWLVDVLNYLTGNLDREGGAMFPLAAAAQRNSAGAPDRSARACGSGAGRAASAGSPRSFGELPVAGLAEEITTPGDGQVRALLTIAGNPLRLDPGLGGARGRGRRRSTSSSRSTSTSTRRPATPTSSSPPPSRCRRPTTTPRSTNSASAASPTGRPPCCRCPTASRRSGRSSCGSQRSPPARAPRRTSSPGTSSSPRPSSGARSRSPGSPIEGRDAGRDPRRARRAPRAPSG